MTKKTYSFRLDEDLMQRFKEFVLSKYGKIYEVLGTELQQAIAAWMGDQGLAAHTKTHINPGMPRAQTVIDQIISFLRTKGYTNQFRIKDFEEAVMHVAGSDPRTLKKYLVLAKRLGRVKPYAGNVWEIV